MLYTAWLELNYQSALLVLISAGLQQNRGGKDINMQLVT
jgi:hypothetical protein